jgi:hypothetical protein
MLQRSGDRDGPLRPDPIEHLEERRALRSTRVATGTLACPECDAPVVPDGPMSPAEPLVCPYCAHGGPVREFLSLTPPTRPTRVVVRLVQRLRLPGTHV